MSYPTWSDLNSPSIVPPLGQRQAKSVGPAALMVSADPDMGLIRQGFGKWQSRAFFNSSLLVKPEAPLGMSVTGPYIGAPYGVMLLESLIAKGARAVIVLGWCGGLSPDFFPGDLVVVENALVDEGTSRHYMDLSGPLPAVKADARLTATLAAALGAAGLESYTHATIWSTDAIYRETPEKVSWYKDNGACAVEMECSALFAAAAFRKVPIAALLVVSDSLGRADGAWDPGFNKKRFKVMRKQACGVAMALTGKLAHGF
ncbi:uridine phosphorylase [Desulfobacter hydrogenophilus]|uniref:Uridine phosphorylase n=1 Tax=Desulfobacter hydrogenophilus TaxID=2291 RepID=A0A328FKE5_9BACT|nr:nucleoside phosphorylase [Desulfobacter hydrogenophilus]NDY71744.1 nucleoside phosphorylase [Desulfobacter hydrogenophilus]QBH13441.1 uridine phosphorylase [Desulfobacter hydrogenophilus]RAM03693.1 uridine phosphorylase [Desulfobacter hydrogenophilus]